MLVAGMLPDGIAFAAPEDLGRPGPSGRCLRGAALRAAVRIVEQAAAGLKSPDLLPVQRKYVQACEAAEAAEVQRLTTLNQRAVARSTLMRAPSTT